MTTSLPMQCLACDWLDRSRTEAFSDRPIVESCAAFPAGIPDEILAGADHRTPTGGETDGLTFAMADDGSEAFRAWERLNAALTSGLKRTYVRDNDGQFADVPGVGDDAIDVDLDLDEQEPDELDQEFNDHLPQSYLDKYGKVIGSANITGEQNPDGEYLGDLLESSRFDVTVTEKRGFHVAHGIQDRKVVQELDGFQALVLKDIAWDIHDGSQELPYDDDATGVRFEAEGDNILVTWADGTQMPIEASRIDDLGEALGAGVHMFDSEFGRRKDAFHTGDGSAQVRAKRTYVRDSEGQFAETPGGGSSGLDKLKLGKRIQLPDGHELLSSRKFRSTDQYGGHDLLAAEVQTPSGREIRLGVIHPDDSRHWTAQSSQDQTSRRIAELDRLLEDLDEGDDGYEELSGERLALGDGSGTNATAAVTPESIGAMRAQLARDIDDAKQWASDWNKFFADNPHASQAEIDAMGGPDDILSEGSIPADGGRTLHYQVVADGEELPATWSVQFGIRPSDADEDWYIGAFDDAARFAAKDAPGLLADLAELAGDVTKRASRSRFIKRSSTGETMQLKSFRPQVKAVGANGTATIAIATLNVVDKDGDVTLPGFFGEQHAQMVPVHDWNHVPIGKGRVYEKGNQALVDVKFNLAIPEAKNWYEAIKFDKENPPALQEYSYGYEVLEGGSKQGNFKGRAVRYLTPRPDGSAGSKVFEFSPVLLGAGEGTGTVDVKSLARERIAARKARTGAVGLYQGGVAPHETATVARSWDGVKTVAALADDLRPSQLRSVYAWVDPGGDPELKASYKFPHHHGVSGPANIRACLAGIAVLNGATGGVDLSDADRKSVYDHLASHLKDADREPPALRTDVGTPSGKNLRFGDEAANVLAGVAGLIDRASEVMVLRARKGKGLTANTADLLSWVRDECKRLDSLLAQPIEADDEPSTHVTDEEIASVVLAAVARLHDDN